MQVIGNCLNLYYLPAIVTFLSILVPDIFFHKISFATIRIIGVFVLLTSLLQPTTSKQRNGGELTCQLRKSRSDRVDGTSKDSRHSEENWGKS